MTRSYCPLPPSETTSRSWKRTPGRFGAAKPWVELPEQPGDSAAIAAPLDRLGLNYCFPQTVADDPDGPAPHARAVCRDGVPRTGMDWEIDASGAAAGSEGGCADAAGQQFAREPRPPARHR